MSKCKSEHAFLSRAKSAMHRNIEKNQDIDLQIIDDIRFKFNKVRRNMDKMKEMNTHLLKELKQHIPHDDEIQDIEGEESL
jgi:hypothetical protein